MLPAGTKEAKPTPKPTPKPKAAAAKPKAIQVDSDDELEVPVKPKSAPKKLTAIVDSDDMSGTSSIRRMLVRHPSSRPVTSVSSNRCAEAQGQGNCQEGICLEVCR